MLAKLSDFDQQRADFSQIWRISAYFGRFRPELGQVGPSWTDIGRIWADFLPNSGSFGPFWDDISHIWADFVHDRPNMARISVDFGQILADFSQIWANAIDRGVRPRCGTPLVSIWRNTARSCAPASRPVQAPWR